MFFAKVPQKWSSFLKKLLVFFDTLGGEGGVRPNVTFVTFFFVLKASLTEMINYIQGFP